MDLILYLPKATFPFCLAEDREVQAQGLCECGAQRGTQTGMTPAQRDRMWIADGLVALAARRKNGEGRCPGRMAKWQPWQRAPTSAFKLSQLVTTTSSLFFRHPAWDPGPELLIPELSELQLKAPGVVLGCVKFCVTLSHLTTRSQTSQMASSQAQWGFSFSASLCLHLVSERAILFIYLFILLILLLLQQATCNAQLIGVSEATVCTRGGHHQKLSNYIQASDHMLEEFSIGLWHRACVQKGSICIIQCPNAGVS